MARKTECKRGHDLTDPANVLTKRNGDRQCLPCHTKASNEWSKRRRRERREQLGLPPWTGRIESDVCAVESCDRPREVHAEGCRSRYCSAHLDRWRKHRDVYEDVPIGTAYGTAGLARARARSAVSDEA